MGSIYQSGGQGVTSATTLSEELQGYYLAQALKVVIPIMALEKAMSLPESLPQANSMTVGFQRFEKLDPLNALTPMVEDVSPKSQKIKVTEYVARLQQYGGHVTFTNMLQLTSRNQHVQNYVKRLTEQALEVLEVARWNALKAGSNKFYSVGATRTGVNAPISEGVLKKVQRALRRMAAQPITEFISSTPKYNTESVQKCYLAYGHIDLEEDIRALPGFTQVKDYMGAITPLPGEIGAWGWIRFLLSQLYTPYPNAATGAGLNGMVSTSGTFADVYPLIVFAKDAFTGVPLRGSDSMTVQVINPARSTVDPHGQKGVAAWDYFQIPAVITNDANMAVIECAATELA